MDRCREILEVEREVISKAIGAITLENKIVIEDLNQDLEAFQPNHKAVYLKNFHIAETGIADHLAPSDRFSEKNAENRSGESAQVGPGKDQA